MTEKDKSNPNAWVTDADYSSMVVSSKPDGRLRATMAIAGLGLVEKANVEQTFPDGSPITKGESSVRVAWRQPRDENGQPIPPHVTQGAVSRRIGELEKTAQANRLGR